MAKKDVDYEKMKEEYDRIHPLKLCAEPFFNDEADSVTISSIYKCYENYIKVSSLIKGIKGALPQGLSYIAENIVNLSEHIGESAYTFYKEHGGDKDKTSLSVEKPRYTQSIRNALILSGEVIAFLFEKPLLSQALPLSKMQVVHSLLLTLTAF